MPLDPQAEMLLALVKQSNLPEFWQLTPGQGASSCTARRRRGSRRHIHRTEDRHP
jgi:hypothetical protein